MESDERFKHLVSDPRFKKLRKKERKVEIDDRFKSMFTDDKFVLKFSKDKRGRNNKKTSGDDLKKYYSLKDDGLKKPKSIKKKPRIDLDEVEEKSDEEREDDDEEEEVADEDEEEISDLEESELDHVDKKEECADKEEEEGDEDDDEEISNEEQDESEVSSSSDESDSEVEDDEDEVDVKNLQYDWQPLDHDAETSETTSKRLAIQNLDWDHLDVRDIYTLVNSIRPPMSIKIYVSEFGKERLRDEEMHGPKEIIDMPNVDEEEEEYNMLEKKMKLLKDANQRKLRINEYEDADDQLDPKNEEMRERIRRYQLSRMKYYYAIAEFDSVESAELVYKELDGMEYEGSSLELDLRFVPDDVEFDEQDVKAKCDKLPDLASYKAPQFINSALQQTTVKFTWDETDVKRQEKLSKAYTKEELEMDDLEAYLASGTDSEEEEEDRDSNADDGVSVITANSEARANKYKALLQSLEEEEARKKKVDVDVDWDGELPASDGSDTDSNDDDVLDEQPSDEPLTDDNDDDDIGHEDQEDDQDDDDDDDGLYEETKSVKGRRISKRELKKLERKEKRKKRKLGDRDEDVRREKEDGDNNELDLLVMDVDNKPKEEFKFNPDDKRFNAIYESGLYNIDPSHGNFKRTEAFDLIAEKKRLKRFEKQQRQQG